MFLAFFISNSIREIGNSDWVILVILLCLFLYVFMLVSLNRESSLQDFVLQPLSEAVANITLNWLMVSVVFVLVTTGLVSQYVPIIPLEVSRYQLFGFELNKWGFTCIALSVYFIAKSLLSYLFYMSIGEGKSWGRMNFVATKFYFIYSLVVMVASVVHYYFGIDHQLALRFYWLLFALIFVFKLFYYLFNKNEILPKEWYYKILYICTLQIIPLVVLWRLMIL